MTSLKQIEANRRNAQQSTGPRTELGKERSRGNAVRHGLTAETVIGVLENPEDYKAFELSVTSDFDVETAVERELVLRLASLLWRLRRALAVETGLLQNQGDNLAQSPPAQEIQPTIQSGSTCRVSPIAAFFSSIDSDHGSEQAVARDFNSTVATSFLKLAQLDAGAFERLNRYEISLWRQVSQLLFTLDALRWRKCFRGSQTRREVRSPKTIAFQR
jgi:hypothetical protein